VCNRERGHPTLVLWSRVFFALARLSPGLCFMQHLHAFGEAFLIAKALIMVNADADADALALETALTWVGAYGRAPTTWLGREAA
jgi:hypothetical protein